MALVIYYGFLRALNFTCDLVCFILLAASCVCLYLRLRVFYSTCGFMWFILLAASWFYSTCGFVLLFYSLVLVTSCVCFILLAASWCIFCLTCIIGLRGFILLADLWFYSTCGFVCLILATYGFVVYSTCGFVCFRLLSWLVVLTVVNGSAGMDLTSRLWCDRSCWYCFVASTTCYFFAAIESLLLRGLGSMLLMILFPYGYVFTSIQLCL